ncbi:MAG: isoprenylcysteine carboxylmethyltransferase family protein [Caldilineaceae bacterium]|nr:isoprenylcysteine carboxylmethyltransferase family protein [Caldilineaceae bacterium]
MLKSYTLVLVQFGALIALALTGPLIARHPLLLAMELAALALATWALLTVRIHNINVTPDVRRGSRLVREGPFRWIRHPMYASILIGALALVLNEATPLRWLIYAVLVANLLVKLSYEERLLVAAFPLYADYQKTSKRLLPFIY